MARDRYIEAIFPIKCYGRTAAKKCQVGGKAVLKDPVDVEVVIIQHNGDEASITLTVKCPFNTGAHGRKCKASRLDSDKPPLIDIICPYAADIPYELEYINKY